MCISVGDKGIKVLSRDGKKIGKTTGGTRVCQMEGCLGRRVGVRWDDGTMTWPCSKGMEIQGDSWKIV